MSLSEINVHISRTHFPITTLGPGQRIGIWFQGCSIRCRGCVSADTWGTERGLTTVSELLDFIAPWSSKADGFTISGGEPFDQATALLELLRSLRRNDHQDVLIYSGHPIERIAETVRAADGLIDALVTDPYDQTVPQTLALRGSDNQRLHLLSELGQTRYARYQKKVVDTERALDLMFDEDGTVWIAGIPRPRDMLRLRAILASKGHSALTTDSMRFQPEYR